TAGKPFRIVRSQVAHEHAYAPHALALRRARRKRPCCRAAEQRDELAPVAHSITSSARAISDGGTSRPTILAAVRLLTSSNFVGTSSGTSPGLAPFRILSTKVATRRQFARRSIP